MKLIFVKFETGYVGMEAYNVYDIEGMSEQEINLMLDWEAHEHAESYGIELCSEDREDPDCAMEHDHSNITFCYEDYVPEKHDMYRSHGSFMDEFKDFD